MRYLICKACADKGSFKLTPEDVAYGFKERRKELVKVQRPTNLARTETVVEGGHTHVKQTLLQSIECDGCGERVPNGSSMVAITHWRREEPPEWEHEYV